MKENRDLCINMVFGDEKGFVNRPKTDAGGATNMGITIKTLSAWRGRPVSVEEVKALTRSEAYDIYAKEYWTPIRGDDMPAGLDYSLFDSCVTSGPNRSIRILQEALKIMGCRNADGTELAVDGNIGVNTMAAIKSLNSQMGDLIVTYNSCRIKFMQGIGGPKGFKANGRGWTIRVTGVDPKGQWKTQPGVVGNSLKMLKAAKSTDPAAGPKPLPSETPLPVAVEAGAKTDDAAISIPEIIKQPEILKGGTAAIVAIITAISANTLLSYALAFAIAVGALAAGYSFVRRIRHSYA